MRKVLLNPSPASLISCAFVLSLLIASPSYAQEATALQKVQSLKNPSFTNKTTVYYSPGYEKKGLSFIAEVGNAFPAPEGDGLPVAVVLQRLEKLSPVTLRLSSGSRYRSSWSAPRGERKIRVTGQVVAGIYSRCFSFA
jgi:hypothetical protein